MLWLAMQRLPFTSPKEFMPAEFKTGILYLKCILYIYSIYNTTSSILYTRRILIPLLYNTIILLLHIVLS